MSEIATVLVLTTIAAAAVTGMRCTRIASSRRSQQPWRLLALAGLTFAAVTAICLVGDEGTHVSLAAAELVPVPLLAAALAWFAGTPPHASGRGRTLVDGLIMGGSALLVALAVGLADLYASHPGPAQMLLIAQALGYLAVGSAGLVMATRARPGLRRSLALTGVGLCAIAVSAAAEAYHEMGGALTAAQVLLVGGAFGWLLIADAARVEDRRRRGPRPSDERLEPGLPTQASVFVPSVPFAIAVLTATWVGARGSLDPAMIWTGGAVILLVVLRQVLALVENISFWHQLEARIHARTGQLRDSEARFRSLVQNSSDVITLVGPDGSVRYQSPSLLPAFGYPADYFDRNSPLELIHPEDLPHVLAAARRLSAEPEGTASLECRVLHRSGGWRQVSAIVNNLLHDSAVGAFVVNTRDVTELKERERLAHQAFHDRLTSLANRALFDDRLEHAIARAERGGHYLAVLFLDLDGFKAINDRFGHTTGDGVLAEVGSRLRTATRAGDTVARIGGDEFAVLAEEVDDVLGATRLADRLLTALEAPFEVEDETARISGSIGIASYPEAGESATELLRSADLAMYAAKGRGPGFFHVSSHGLESTNPLAAA